MLQTLHFNFRNEVHVDAILHTFRVTDFKYKQFLVASIKELLNTSCDKELRKEVEGKRELNEKGD